MIKVSDTVTVYWGVRNGQQGKVTGGPFKFGYASDFNVFLVTFADKTSCLYYEGDLVRIPPPSEIQKGDAVVFTEGTAIIEGVVTQVLDDGYVVCSDRGSRWYIPKQFAFKRTIKSVTGGFAIGQRVRVKNSARKGRVWCGLVGQIVAFKPDRHRTVVVDFLEQKGRGPQVVRYKPEDLEPAMRGVEGTVIYEDEFFCFPNESETADDYREEPYTFHDFISYGPRYQKWLRDNFPDATSSYNNSQADEEWR